MKHSDLDAARGVFRWTLCLAVAAIAVALLVACGGSSAPAASNAPAATVPPASGSSSSSDPPAQSSSSSSYVPGGLPTCAVGTTLLYISVCSCPAGDANGSSCEVPAPVCPQGEQGTPPNCTPIPAPVPPTMSLNVAPDPLPYGASATLTWTSTGAAQCVGASGWPSSGWLQPSGWISTGPLYADATYTLVCSGSGGTASQSAIVHVSPGSGGSSSSSSSQSSSSASSSSSAACNPPDVLIGQQCSAPPVLSLTLSINPTTVADNRAGCPDPTGLTCTATISLAVSSSLPTTGTGTIICTDQNGNLILNPAGFSTVPFPSQQDGPHVYTVTCVQYQVPVSASITLTVVPPSAPPPPIFTCALNGGAVTCTWNVYGAGGCDVELFNTNGVEWTLTPGGTASGSATSGFLSPAYDPWTANLYCDGLPEAGVPSLSFSP